MRFTDFNLGNGPAEDVEAEHDLEFQFALYQDDQSEREYIKFKSIWFGFFLADKW